MELGGWEPAPATAPNACVRTHMHAHKNAPPGASPPSLQWQNSKKLTDEGLIAHVGKHQYALTAFPGVVHIPHAARTTGQCRVAAGRLAGCVACWCHAGSLNQRGQERVGGV